MKNIFRTLALVSVLAGNLGAASITVTNFDAVSPFYNPIINSSGALVSSGIIVIGTFDTTPTTPGNILSSFNQLGTQSLNFLAPGFFQGNISAAIPVGSSFVGKKVYVVIGNGTTIANSTELLAWEALANPAGNTYTADDPEGGPNSVAVRNSTGDARVGNETTYDFGAGGPGIQPALQLVAVPEPSSLMLGVLGVLALLRRKR